MSTPRSRVRLLPLPVTALEALTRGDPAAASAIVAAPLPAYCTSSGLARIRPLHLERRRTDPGTARWSIHTAIAEPSGPVIGHGGFHGPPDPSGTVEIGYSVDEAHRRCGYATAIVQELLSHAARAPSVTTVRASNHPSNTASLALITRLGFSQTPADIAPTAEPTFEIPVRRA